MNSIHRVKVSIIVPTYNAALYLEQTLDSVRNQSHENWELIVVDDGSSDDTPKILEHYCKIEPRMVTILLPENSGGPALPRNIGLSKASGQMVCMLDSDDIWHPEKLAFQISNMISSDINFSSTKLVIFNKVVHFQNLSSLVSSALDYVNLELLLSKNIFATSSVMIDRGLIGGSTFSESPEHRAIEDYLLWLELLQKPETKSARFHERLVAYRLRENSLSRSKFKMAKKLFHMLGGIELNGNRLGSRRYYYFLMYIWGSLRSSMYD